MAASAQEEGTVGAEAIGAPGPTLLTSAGRLAEQGQEGGKGNDAAAARLERAQSLRSSGSIQRTLANAGKQMTLQRSESLPTSKADLRHAATMPLLHDMAADRPCCGFLTMKQTFGLLLGISLFVFFVAVRIIETYSKANDMLGITALMACFWAFEVMPIYATALMPMVLIPFMEINSTANVAVSYFNETQMLFLGMFLLDIAMEQVELPRRIALKLLMRFGVTRPGALLASFMALSWVLSMVTSSTIVVLMVAPVAISLMNAAEEQARQEIEAGSGQAEGEQVESVQHLAVGLLLGIAFGATTGGLAMLNASPANGVLAGNELARDFVGYGRWFLYALPVSVVNALSAFLVLYARYASRARVELPPELLRAEYADLVAEAGEASRDELAVGLVLCLMVLGLVVSPWAITPYLTPDRQISLVSGASIACLCGLSLFLVPSRARPGEALLTWRRVHEKLDVGVLLLLGGGFGLASGLKNSGLEDVLGAALGQAADSASPFLLNAIIIITVSFMVQVFGCAATASTVLPIISAACTDVLLNPLRLMLPATVACSFAYMMPMATPPNVIATALSSGLARPLRVRDFLLNGLPVTLAAVLVGAVLTHCLDVLVFGFAPQFPEENCAVKNCYFLDIPGEVRGQQVDHQACLLLDSVSDAAHVVMCRLWNRTVVTVNPDYLPQPIL